MWPGFLPVQEVVFKGVHENTEMGVKEIHPPTGLFFFLKKIFL
jgi:hypothetical protein